MRGEIDGLRVERVEVRGGLRGVNVVVFFFFFKQKTAYEILA